MFGLAFQAFNAVGVLLSLIGVDTGIVVGGLGLEHKVNDTGEFVSGGDISLHDALAITHAAVVRTERGLAFVEGAGGIAKGLSSAVPDFFGVGFLNLAAGDVVVRAETKPGAEVLDGGPAGHIGADFGDNRLSGQNVNTVNVSEIHTGHLVKGGAEIEIGLVIAFGVADFLRGKGVLEDVNLGLEDGELSFDFVITSLDFVVIDIIHIDHLLKKEEMFGLEIAEEGLSNFFLGVFASGMAELSEDEGVAFAVDDGADNEHAGLAGDVGEDVSEFDVHQLEGLLDVLDMSGAIFDENVPLADESPEGADLWGGDERAAEEAVGVELLDPLAIEDIGLLAGDILDVSGIDDEDLKTVLFEDFEGRDPVDAGGFHSNGGDLGFFEPVSEGMEIGGESGKLPDGSVETAFGDSGPNLLIADIETGSVEIDLFE